MKVDPVISQAVATLIGAISTAILMWASFNWGPRRRNKEQEDEE